MVLTKDGSNVVVHDKFIYSDEIYYKFKEGIKEIDKNAFITVIDAYEVLGGE